jgi:hypothetical protein
MAEVDCLSLLKNLLLSILFMITFFYLMRKRNKTPAEEETYEVVKKMLNVRGKVKRLNGEVVERFK